MSEELMKIIFSNNLDRYMDVSGVSQNDIIRDLHVPSATISSWVNGKRIPRMNKIQELADYLHITKADLIENVVIGDFKTEKEALDYVNEIKENPMATFKYFNPNPEEFSLSNVYLSLAKEAQDNNIDPRDIRMALDMLKKLKEETHNNK